MPRSHAEDDFKPAPRCPLCARPLVSTGAIEDRRDYCVSEDYPLAVYRFWDCPTHIDGHGVWRPEMRADISPKKWREWENEIALFLQTLRNF